MDTSSPEGVFMGPASEYLVPKGIGVSEDSRGVLEISHGQFFRLVLYNRKFYNKSYG